MTWKFDTCSIAFGQKQIFATTFFLYSKLEGDNGFILAKETENICNNVNFVTYGGSIHPSKLDLRLILLDS